MELDHRSSPRREGFFVLIDRGMRFGTAEIPLDPRLRLITRLGDFELRDTEILTGCRIEGGHPSHGGVAVAEEIQAGRWVSPHDPEPRVDVVWQAVGR